MIRLKPVIVFALASLLNGLCPPGTYGDCDYYLHQPLQFADAKVQGCVSKYELESAFGRKVKIGTDSDDGYEFLSDERGSARTENCNDFIKAKNLGPKHQSHIRGAVLHTAALLGFPECSYTGFLKFVKVF